MSMIKTNAFVLDFSTTYIYTLSFLRVTFSQKKFKYFVKTSNYDVKLQFKLK